MAATSDDAADCPRWVAHSVLHESGFLRFLREHEIELKHLKSPEVEGGAEAEEKRFFRLNFLVVFAKMSLKLK